jgi:hypothetical protein
VRPFVVLFPGVKQLLHTAADSDGLWIPIAVSAAKLVFARLFPRNVAQSGKSTVD